MEVQQSKVYVLPNTSGYITRVDGGYTISNITDFSGWVLIDEGYGDRYNLCQGLYFEKPIITAYGAYQYKLVDGKPVACSQAEFEEQENALASGTKLPTWQDQMEAQLMYTALMTDTILEEGV